MVLGLSLGSGVATAQVLRAQDMNLCTGPAQPAFRYVITWNHVTEGTSYPEGKKRRLRGVDVLLDAKSFSESTLKQLLDSISKRFPDPDELFVNVYTNLEDASTPEEAEHTEINCILALETPNYPWAVYRRDLERETLTYHAKKPGSVVNSVMLRGKD
jgi:hypothetical protein